MKRHSNCPHCACPRIKFSPSMMGLVGAALLLILSFAFSIAVFASTSKPLVKGAPSATTQPKPSVSREIIFDGSAVNGRYHSAGEAVARVEAEKNLNELIGPRRDFRDRLKLERARLVEANRASAPATSEAELK